MEWVIAVVGGLVVFGLTEGGRELWRRYWNPISWEFTIRNDQIWDMNRKTRPKAFAVCFAHPRSQGPTFYNPGDPPKAASMDIQPKTRRAVNMQGVSGGFYLFWVERNRRHMAWVEIPPGTITKTVRRRESKTGKDVDENFSKLWEFRTPNMYN